MVGVNGGMSWECGYGKDSLNGCKGWDEGEELLVGDTGFRRYHGVVAPVVVSATSCETSFMLHWATGEAAEVQHEA